MPKKIEVLISCMDQPDLSIAHRTNLSTDAVIINQCGQDSYREEMINGRRIRMVSCADRGLSKSRNKAVGISDADICLLCDDDERLEDDYEKKILEAYAAYPDADVIAFRVKYPMKKFWKSARRVGRLDALQIASWQITFKRGNILLKGISFDERFGAGTKFPPAEDNIFLYECLNKGLRIYYVPELIASVSQDQSTWFRGFTEAYFINRGITTRFYMGFLAATLYAFYFAAAKHGRYRKNISCAGAVQKMLTGIYSKKIERPY